MDNIKYDVKFCSCGRVHFINEENISRAIENNKEVLVICNNCGNSFVIGVDETEDESGETCYYMYSHDIRNKAINDTSKIDSIVLTAGEQIRMMTGGEATYHGNSTFIDWYTNKPENVSNDEWESTRKTVNVQHTINWIKDDNKLEQMSHYCSGIDWKGTKYEAKYNY